MYQALFHKIHASGAGLLVIKLDQLVDNIKHPSATERKILLENRTWKYYLAPGRNDELTQYYSEYDSLDDIMLLFDYKRSYLRLIFKNGISILADTASRYYNVVNGGRITTDCPDHYKNTIHIFGNCNAVGCFTEDKYTIASQLQREINTVEPNTTRVVNRANWLPFEETCRQIISPLYTFGRNDLVIILSHDVVPAKCDSGLRNMADKRFYRYVDLSEVFQRPHAYGEVLFDNIHMAHRGYSILTRHIFDIITESRKTKESDTLFVPADLLPYLQYLKMLRKKKANSGEVVGALVMNCNPFTSGHKFLVTEALLRCDYLYIFILDEDKSHFSFDDRIAMVKLGLGDIPNVSVVPSGITIISSETMPEYFSKDDMQDVTIDTSYDVTLFATIIAPTLGITKRFAGSEPFCYITRQYNDGMRSILPRHGIEFIELPRFAVDGQEVSASRVRECIKNGDHAAVKGIVPASTYAYLIEKNHLSTTVPA